MLRSIAATKPSADMDDWDVVTRAGLVGEYAYGGVGTIYDGRATRFKL